MSAGANGVAQMMARKMSPAQKAATVAGFEWEAKAREISRAMSDAAFAGDKEAFAAAVQAQADLGPAPSWFA